jgi:hypothetical protein
MSFKAMAWAASVRTGSSTKKIILLLLADRANDKGECYPSIKTISEDAELSDRCVTKNIGELESSGFVRVENRVNTSNLYRLNIGFGGERGSGGVVNDVPTNLSSEPINEPTPTPSGCSTDKSVGEGDGTPPVAPPPPEGFDEFWRVYPRKDNKAKAVKAWRKLMKEPNHPAVADITAHIEKRIKLGAWSAKKKNFIPNPEAFINGRRWEDEIITQYSDNPKDAPRIVCTEKLSDGTVGRGIVYMTWMPTPNGLHSNRTVTNEEFREKIQSGEWINGGPYREWLASRRKVA